jgi:hypothetical protein
MPQFKSFSSEEFLIMSPLKVFDVLKATTRLSFQTNSNIIILCFHHLRLTLRSSLILIQVDFRLNPFRDMTRIQAQEFEQSFIRDRHWISFDIPLPNQFHQKVESLLVF